MGIIVLVVVGLGVILSRTENTAVAPAKSTGGIIREDSHMTGDKNAKVTVVEFGDYQCPACAAANPIVKQIISDYKNNKDFNFVFMNFPLAQHANAQISAEAAEAAGEQGKFWEMHDKIYESQNKWNNVANPLGIFVGYAQQLSLDTAKFKQAIQENKFKDIIAADASKGTELGVNATPTFFINQEKLPGIPDQAGFKKIIDDALSK